MYEFIKMVIVAYVAVNVIGYGVIWLLSFTGDMFFGDDDEVKPVSKPEVKTALELEAEAYLREMLK